MASYIASDYSSNSDTYESDSDYMSPYEQYVTRLACHLAEIAPVSTDVGKVMQEQQEKRNAEIAANKKASELILEEELEKMTTEIHKEKAKKRHKKKKSAKQQRISSKKMDKNNPKQDETHYSAENDSESGNEEEGLDPHSAFVSEAAGKSLATKSIVKHSKLEKQQTQTQPTLTSVQAKAYSWAQLGNLKANQDKFEEAIQNYTKAINLQPNDHRFYGNRSFCYERIGNYEKALVDASKAIQLEMKWPKNYFRKGLALIGLKKYEDAEAAFNDLLALNNACNEAREVLFSLRMLRLQGMGFTEDQAYFASVKYDTVEAAVDGIVSGRVPDNMFDEIFISDDEDQLFYASMQTQSSTDTKSIQISSSTENSSSNVIVTKPSLWVGNISISVEEAEIRRLFARYGDIVNVHCLTDIIIGNKYCAFVNFKDRASAAKALNALQGYSCHGYNLDIKYANNDNQTLKKTNASRNSASGTKPSSNLVLPVPVNGECYYWRKQGYCRYDDDKCKFKHVKEHKGIDKLKTG